MVALLLQTVWIQAYLISAYKTAGGFAKIVKGGEATLGQFPFEVELLLRLTKGKLECSGSIINSHTVLTAAHCFDDPYESIKVIMGHTQSDSVREVYKIIYTKIMDVYIPTEYSDKKAATHDLALVRLPRPIPKSRYIDIINLPSDDGKPDLIDLYAGKTATVVGWGLVTKEAPAKVLRFGRMAILERSICVKHYPFFYNDEHGYLLCAVGYGIMICGGDSGGPLFYSENGKDVQVGITSFVNPDNPCEDVHSPQGFVTVAAHLEWIHRVNRLEYVPDMSYKWDNGVDKCSPLLCALIVCVFVKCVLI